MLWIASAILLLLWLVGIVTAHTAGGFIHLLLILAVAFLLVQVLEERRTV